jgi:hypothetical protein
MPPRCAVVLPSASVDTGSDGASYSPPPVRTQAADSRRARSSSAAIVPLRLNPSASFPSDDLIVGCRWLGDHPPMPIEPPPIRIADETPHAREMRRRLQHAAHMREYRAEQKQVGRPTTRTVDKALVEATAFLVRLCSAPPVTVDLAELHRVAVLVLVREGNDRALSRRAVSDRLRPRRQHDSASHVPSLHPCAVDRIVAQPRRGEPWRASELEALRDIARRTRR